MSGLARTWLAAGDPAVAIAEVFRAALACGQAGGAVPGERLVDEANSLRPRTWI